jgi:hypothetical protein
VDKEEISLMVSCLIDSKLMFVQVNVNEKSENQFAKSITMNSFNQKFNSTSKRNEKFIYSPKKKIHFLNGNVINVCGKYSPQLKSE